MLLSRQFGDRRGEANSLANLGYSEVLRAQDLEQMSSEVYENAIFHLQQGLQLSEKQNDWQSQALCLSSLGISHVILKLPAIAVKHLESGCRAANYSGDLYLQGINFTYLAEAYHSLQNTEKAIYSSCIGMYLLEQISAREWKQSAGLLSILRGNLGNEAFQEMLKQLRSQIVKVIDTNGFNSIPKLLENYLSC